MENIEFIIKFKDTYFEDVKFSFCPRVGETINIKHGLFKVLEVMHNIDEENRQVIYLYVFEDIY